MRIENRRLRRRADRAKFGFSVHSFVYDIVQKVIWFWLWLLNYFSPFFIFTNYFDEYLKGENKIMIFYSRKHFMTLNKFLLVTLSKLIILWFWFKHCWFCHTTNTQNASYNGGCPFLGHFLGKFCSFLLWFFLLIIIKSVKFKEPVFNLVFNAMFFVKFKKYL